MVECKVKRQAENNFRNEIPGEANVDYPTLASVPETSFSCSNRVSGGYYADVETDCQVFHICGSSNSVFGSIKYSFVCPNGTVFNQQYFICDWWYNVDCALAPDFYNLNENIGVEPPKSNNNGNQNRRPSSAAGPNKFQSGLQQPEDSLPTYGTPNKSSRLMKKPKKLGRGKGRKSPVRIEITSNDADVFRFPHFGGDSGRQKRTNDLDILTEQEKFLFVSDHEDLEDEYVHNPIFD